MPKRPGASRRHPHQFHQTGGSGRHLVNQVRRAGLRRTTPGVIILSEWDPSLGPSAGGLMPFDVRVDRAVQAVGVTAREGAQWLVTLQNEARDGRFFASLTLIAVAATMP